jgi:hypothetical protein
LRGGELAYGESGVGNEKVSHEFHPPFYYVGFEALLLLEKGKSLL